MATVGFISDESILAGVRRLVKQAVEDAYIEGLVQGGIPADEMTDDDALMIIELNQQQQDYITDFVRAIRAAKGDKAAQRDILDNRVNLWTASIEAAGTAGLNSAKANEMVTWKLGDAEEHCKGPNSCTWLNGQMHRRKWFVARGVGAPGTPGQETPCGGYNCTCSLK